MSNIMTFLVYESVDWEFDNVIAVASTYEKALELLVDHLNDNVTRPDRVDLMQGREDSSYDGVYIDSYRIVQTVINGLRKNSNDIPLFLDNERVIQHSDSAEFQNNRGFFTVDMVKSMLQTREQLKYGVAS